MAFFTVAASTRSSGPGAEVIQSLQLAPAQENSRRVSMRYFCMYRLVIASALVIFGVVFSVGDSQRELYVLTSGAYWVCALAFIFIPLREGALNRALVLYVAVDIIALILMVHADGGYRSGIPYLMMATLAGSGLVGQGHMVFGFAAAATLAVLLEQTARLGSGLAESGDFSRTGMLGLLYFAVAWVSRSLAQRALANEVLAEKRGADLARQQGVNARIIEDMQDGVIVIEDSGRVLQANPGASALLGIAVEPGQHLGEVSVALARQVFATQRPDSPIFRAEHSGASLHVRRVRASAAGDTILYLEDMDRVQAQAQQIKLAALGRLTANIAHEIRNPLSAITHASELLLEEKRAEVQSRLVRIVRDNGARIDRMVRDVLDLGRRDRVTAERLDLQLFVQTFLDELAMHQPHNSAVIVTEFSGSAPLLFDRGHLHQILTNLVSNACRYCSGQPGAVRIALRRQGERLLLVVHDDGAGVPEADRNKIFEPFFTSDPKGTGLGLYIARELAEANGAQLILGESAKGAEFRLIARSAE